MFNGMDLGDLLNKAKELQTNYQNEQSDVAEKTVEVQVGGGMVKVEMSGDLTVKKLTLDPEIIDKEDIETLEDLVAAAMNEAIRKAKELSGGGIGDMMKNFKMPDLGNIDLDQFKK